MRVIKLEGNNEVNRTEYQTTNTQYTVENLEPGHTYWANVMAYSNSTSIRSSVTTPVVITTRKRCKVF